ncbi:hypothetical protein [Streptomyces sp. H39-C1]|uniref:hypothetical protein n=1 Tax=Streptomyces sp. H39-C1 TaxID=3004355 RepID=UPI002F35363A
MIPHINERTHTPHDPLSEALGRPVSPDDGLTEYTVVAHWPGLDSYTLCCPTLKMPTKAAFTVPTNQDGDAPLGRSQRGGRR